MADRIIVVGGDSDLDPDEFEDSNEREGAFAARRRPDRTYVSKSFPKAGAAFETTQARFVRKVFDPETQSEIEQESDGAEWTVRTSPAGRAQVRLLVSGEPGHVSELWIAKVQTGANRPTTTTVLNLQGEDARRLVALVRHLDVIPMSGDESERVDDALLDDLMSPGLLLQAYEKYGDLVRSVIEGDATAQDVVAYARRQSEVRRFRRLLEDDEAFEAESEAIQASGPEDVWQSYFEDNPWILGLGLGSQLLTSWDGSRLQQVVAGHSIAREGKRVDALMRTSGAVRWLTFAEFKTHRTRLLGSEYRPGAWSPSADLAGGVAQVQETVRRALQDIGDSLRSVDVDGAEIPGEITFLSRPRSYLVIGHLSQLLGADGGPHVSRIHSFELYRRNLVEPEVVTFDELLARAEWSVEFEKPSPAQESAIDGL